MKILIWHLDYWVTFQVIQILYCKLTTLRIPVTAGSKDPRLDYFTVANGPCHWKCNILYVYEYELQFWNDTETRICVTRYDHESIHRVLGYVGKIDVSVLFV
jgi:hypothetical protein